ncbi:MAG: hypothetical protein HY291_11100 [Planctomycetes bacterium]|nr:hypothetical protein [Planctomycetota bacterium]
MNTRRAPAWLLLAAALLAARTGCAAEEPNLPTSESRIVWEPELRVKRAEKVFPSPHEPYRVWVCTPQAIMETLDEGATWKALPNSGREQFGHISDAYFSPLSDRVILLGSREKGVFRSNDNGQTWQNSGTTKTGLKSDQVVRLCGHPLDRSGRTFYAAHGDAAPGISKSLDGGATWFTVAENLYAEEILLERREFIMAAHSKQEQDLWSLYQSDDSGQSFLEVVRDVRPTVSGVNRSTVGMAWFGVLKGRLLHRNPLGKHQKTGEWTFAGPADEGSWASIFSTMGKKPDQDIVYAYDPCRFGLLASQDDFKTWWPENNGLYVGRLVKDGANICTTANGKAFFASINGQLYAGRIPEPEGPQIATYGVTPTVVDCGAAATVVFKMRVEPGDKDPKSKITNVHVNLTALKGPGNFALLDDGKHDDGAAGDGLFGGSFEMKGDFLKQWWVPEKRWSLPGQVMLDLAARDAKGRVSTEKLPLSVFAKPETQTFWNGDEVRWGGRMVEGRRGASAGKFDGRSGIIFELDEEAHAGQRCMHVVALRGPWLTGWGQEYDGKNLTDMDYLCFWIKASCKTTRDLKVLLTDAPGGENDARHSDAVWLLKDGYLKELTTEYQRVRIPIAKLIAKTGFNLDMCGGIAFGGDDPHGHNVYVDDIVMEVEEAKK